MILMHRKPAPNGFTFLELSIVLVIIGLIIGGILVGKTMQRSSYVQSMISDQSRYIEAARQFKEKYGYLPGDFPNATTYWGTNTALTQAPTTLTLNGNGDGMIGGEGGSTFPNQTETFLAWQHLADAGMIEGSYSGIGGSGCTTQSAPNLNEPVGKLSSVSGFEWDLFTSTYEAQYFPGVINYTQYLLTGTSGTSPCYGLIYPNLTAFEAQSVDSKLDDGMPTTGKWIASNKSSGCENTSSPIGYYTASGKFGDRISCSFAIEVDW